MHSRIGLLFALELLLAWALPSACWGDPVPVAGGTLEQKASAKIALDRAVVESREAKQRVEECANEVERVSQAIENEQSNNSPVKKAKVRYRAAIETYKEQKKQGASGSEDPVLAKARVTVAEEEYFKIRDELLKNDQRWIDATKPLRIALVSQRDTTTALERRRIESLALTGAIAGVYQPPPQDPATALRAMAQLNTLTVARAEAFKRGHPAPWSIGSDLPPPVPTRPLTTQPTPVAKPPAASPAASKHAPTGKKKPKKPQQRPRQ
ncbi:MAG: hypothetical protein K8T91_12360 [Planctomycetes bacterium]|nr:hypothetical protein [Planctomycetota bacterium]